MPLSYVLLLSICVNCPSSLVPSVGVYDSTKMKSWKIAVMLRPSSWMNPLFFKICKGLILLKMAVP